MPHFSRLFSSQFIFNPALSPMTAPFARFFYILFGLCLVLALASRFMALKKEKEKNLPQRKLWRKLTNFFLGLGLIGFILLFFRQQHVYFLSMPFLWYLSFLGCLAWLFFIIRWALTKMKKIQQEITEKKELEKYLP